MTTTRKKIVKKSKKTVFKTRDGKILRTKDQEMLALLDALTHEGIKFVQKCPDTGEGTIYDDGEDGWEVNWSPSFEIYTARTFKDPEKAKRTAARIAARRLVLEDTRDVRDLTEAEETWLEENGG